MEDEEKKEPTKRDRLLQEKRQLEEDIRNFGQRVSESQLRPYRDRIAAIEKELSGGDKTKQFNMANDKLKSQMAPRNTIDMQQLMQQQNGGMAV